MYVRVSKFCHVMSVLTTYIHDYQIHAYLSSQAFFCTMHSMVLYLLPYIYGPALFENCIFSSKTPEFISQASIGKFCSNGFGNCPVWAFNNAIEGATVFASSKKIQLFVVRSCRKSLLRPSLPPLSVCTVHG